MLTHDLARKLAFRKLYRYHTAAAFVLKLQFTYYAIGTLPIHHNAHDIFVLS